jgi:hypothetical protein
MKTTGQDARKRYAFVSGAPLGASAAAKPVVPVTQKAEQGELF